MWFVTLVLLGIAVFLVLSALKEREMVKEQDKRGYQ